MKTERILIIIMAVWMSGCYTRFATLEDRYSREPGRIAEDSTGERTRDTVVISERETCYWHRTFFGDWELRCYETNYSDEWYSYYHRPWWYHQSSHYFYDCSCPYHIMYNPHCDYCWYYCNKYHHKYIHYIQNTGAISTGTGTSIGPGKKKPRPPIHPVTTGGVKGSGTGTAGAAVIQKDKPSIVEIGEDDNNSQNTIIKTGKKLPGSSRPPLKPSTAHEKKKAILSGDQNVKNKGVLKENIAPKKTGVQGKGKKLINSTPPGKKEDTNNKKQGPRKRRSPRGK